MLVFVLQMKEGAELGEDVHVHVVGLQKKQGEGEGAAEAREEQAVEHKRLFICAGFRWSASSIPTVSFGVYCIEMTAG